MRPRIAPLAFVALAVLLLLGPAPPARAVPITFAALGHVTSNESDPGGYPFAVGEGVTLNFAFTVGAGTPGAFPGSTAYSLESPSFRVTTASGYTSSSTRGSGSAVVTDSPEGDRVYMQIGNADSHLMLRFEDPSGSVLSSQAWPTMEEFVAFGTFEILHIRGIDFRNADGFLADMDLISNAAPVPEPSTLAMGGIGFLLALGHAWRRRRAARPAHEENPGG